MGKATKFGQKNKQENKFLNQFHTKKVEEEKPKPPPQEGNLTN